MKTNMRSSSSQLNILVVAAAVLLATVGCSVAGSSARIGDTVTRSESVERGDAESVNVEIQMAAGELVMRGGANGLLDADLTYNVAELEPEVEYSEGTLVVRTPEGSTRLGSLWDLDEFRYEWDLRFSEDVPMEMRVAMGAGAADLELGDLSLTSLEIQTGASEVKVDLSDSSSLTNLNVEAGIGRVALDLSGDWQGDLDAAISGGVGETTVRLPRIVCVRVDVEGGLGEVRTRGLTTDGNLYVNDACGKSDVTLRVDISAGVGAVDLEVEE
jgi:hypothetical protein